MAVNTASHPVKIAIGPVKSGCLLATTKRLFVYSRSNARFSVLFLKSFCHESRARIALSAHSPCTHSPYRPWPKRDENARPLYFYRWSYHNLLSGPISRAYSCCPRGLSPYSAPTCRRSYWQRGLARGMPPTGHRPHIYMYRLAEPLRNGGRSHAEGKTCSGRSAGCDYRRGVPALGRNG